MAEFSCEVGGDPPPEILWRRHDGKMPIGRARIMANKSLHIDKVTIQDKGTYICDAENSVGAISASATLIVHCKFSQNILNKNKNKYVICFVYLQRNQYLRISPRTKS